MAFSFTPQQQQPQQSLFQSPFQQSSPFQQQTQSAFQFQPSQPQFQQQQPQAQQQQQQQLYLLTNDKIPATYSTKWADLHPDSQKVLLQIEEKILEYRDESQRLDQCSRLYDSSTSNTGFELDTSYIVQEVGGISITMERQKATLQELMTIVKDMLRNTEVAVRSFMMLRHRFHQNKPSTAIVPAQSQPSSAIAPQPLSTQPAANSLMPMLDFYSGLPKKPSPFMLQTVARFEKYLSECCQWIEELEQLLLLDSEKNSLNQSSSLLQSLPKVITNVHAFFVHVAAKVESIHQYIESMKAAYLADQRRRGDVNNPFLEADRRAIAKQEAAARRVHPTLHLHANPASEVNKPVASSAASGTSTATNLPAPVSASTGGGLFSTPAPASTSLFGPSTTPSMFSTPTTSAAPLSLFGTASATPQSSSFGSLTPSTSVFNISTPSLFGSTPASGVSNFTTPFGTGAATGSNLSFGTTSKPRAKSRSSARR